MTVLQKHYFNQLYHAPGILSTASWAVTKNKTLPWITSESTSTSYHALPLPLRVMQAVPLGWQVVFESPHKTAAQNISSMLNPVKKKVVREESNLPWQLPVQHSPLPPGSVQATTSFLISMVIHIRLEANWRTSIVKALAFLELDWDSNRGCDAEDSSEDCNELHSESWID